MNWTQFFQSVLPAIALAIIFGLTKLFQRLGALEVKGEPVVTWYVKTSMDALKIATNPTSERLTELSNQYADYCTGKKHMTTQEKQELIDGLYDVFMNPKTTADKRTSASISLRFLEGREGLSAKKSEPSIDARR